MATKLTYEKLCDICYARNTEHVWFIDAVNKVKVSFNYDDCNHSMHVTVGGLLSITFDKFRLNELTEGIIDLYKRDVFLGCLDISHLEAWE